MSVRTVSELSRVVREDLAFRRKEILAHVRLVANVEASGKQPALRGAVAVLYAHWEGFVKFALQQYVSFVRQQGAKHRELTDCFIAMAAKKQIEILVASKRPRLQIDFVTWLTAEWDKRAHLPKESIIDARSNLNVEVFQDLVCQVGLPYRNEYSVAEKPVIQRLVDLRNDLAHGKWKQVDEAEWNDQLHPRVRDMLELLCVDVENSATQKGYLRASPVILS